MTDTDSAAGSPQRKAWVFGGTGLVGGHLLCMLAADRNTQTTAFARRAFSPALQPPLKEAVVNLADSSTWPSEPVDVAFCCLGTTIKVAGSQEAFVAVDETLVLALAAHARAHGCRHFLVVTAMGANPRSPVFYNKVKGRTEEALKALGFERLTILRPSLLDGNRAESRPGERVGLLLARAFRPLIPKKYQAVQTATVARCLLEISQENSAGVKIVESDLIQAHHRS